MSEDVVIGLVENAALLLSLGLIYDVFFRRERAHPPHLQKIGSGLVVGGIAVVLMLTPVRWEPGVIFDTRTILLGLTGLFFGTVPTLLAMAIAGVYRLSLGGGGAVMGVATIVSSGLAGLVWRHYRFRESKELSLAELYAFGVVVHATMILCMFLLPRELVQKTLGSLALPIIVIYPVGTALLGNLLVGRQRRYRVDEEVADGKAMFEGIFNAIPDAIVYADVDRNVVAINPGFTSVLGYTLDDLAGKPTALFYENREEYEKQGRFRFNLTATGNDLPYLCHYRRKDGAVFPGETLGTVIRNAGGSVLGYIAVIRDITDRKRAEEALRDAAMQWQSTFDATSDAICLLDADQKIVKCNKAMGVLAGIPADAMIGRHCWEVVHATTGPIPECPMQRMRQSQHREQMEVCLGDRWLQVTVDPYAGQGQAYAGAVHTMRDITEQKKVEESLQENQEKYRGLSEGAFEAIFISEKGQCLEQNKRAEEMFGYSTEEAVGRPGAEWIVPADRDRVTKNTMTGFELPYEAGGLRKDGSTFPALLRGRLMHFKDRAVQVTSMSDISERKQAEAAHASLEAQLRESQKMQAIGTLAGGIAHDFNNALATILGNVELARQDASTNPAALESLEEIRKASARTRDLVQQILSFSRKQPIERRPTALAPVVAESVRLLRASVPARLALDVDCADDVPAVLADASQIQQVLINLATNAMQAMQGGHGRIGIRLDTVTLDSALADARPALRALHALRPGCTVRLAVSDDGPGMDKTMQERIFEPFFTTKPLGVGTGLGLSVVHGIVRAHEGVIAVDSAPGKGATFTLYLPLAEIRTGVPETAMRGAAAAPPLSLSSGRHILYIDDDESLVFLVQRLLERRGFRVSGYVSQPEALAALRADPHRFDLVVTDYNMPGLSGLDVAREVRAIRADLPVAVASGFIDEELRAQAAGAGVRELIFKVDAAQDLCEAFARLAQTLGPEP